MKFTIIKPDNAVYLDHFVAQFDLSSLPEKFKVLQWDGEVGHIEWEDKPNTKIEAIDDYKNFYNEILRLKEEYDIKQINPYWGVTQDERREIIKNKVRSEKFKRAGLGVKVGDHWFETDSYSRLQYLYLLNDETFVEGPWETMSGEEVVLNKDLLKDIVKSIKKLDNDLFLASKKHKKEMESSKNPIEHDHTKGWPINYRKV